MSRTFYHTDIDKKYHVIYDDICFNVSYSKDIKKLNIFFVPNNI